MSAFTKIKGLLIDPEIREISEIDIEVNSKTKSCLESLRSNLKCDWVDVVRSCLTFLPSSPQDDIWFDDEGNYGDCPCMFAIPGFVPIIGRGLILSFDDNGGCQDHSLTKEDIDFLRKNTQWLERVIEN